MPVGAQASRRIDVRVIASTNRNLSQMVEETSFRQDLFFRLNVFAVYMPPLRARSDDIEALAQYFLERTEQQDSKSLRGLAPETLERLRGYSWPGNVRELENEIERLVILAEPHSEIPPSLLSERIRKPRENKTPVSLRDQLSELERRLILDALRRHDFNKTQAAEALGITRQTIITKLKTYDADR